MQPSFAMHYFHLKQVCLKAKMTGNCLCTMVMQYVQIYSLLLARCALNLITRYGVAVPCFTEACYVYICTGDVELASQKCKLQNIPDLDVQETIAKVRYSMQPD